MKRPHMPIWQMGSYITTIYLFYLLVLYPRRHMPSIQNGKNISIHFTEDEIPLLDEFEQYRKQNYINRSGWVKQHMKKALTENKRQLAFR